MCCDPTNPRGFFIGDLSSIRYCDGETVRLVAGHETYGYRDGVSEDVRFHIVEGIICAQDGKTLYISDAVNHRIRTVLVTTRTVMTIAGGEPVIDPKSGSPRSIDGVNLNARFSRPQKLTFDRAPTTGTDTPAESRIYIASDGGIRRFDLLSGLVSTLPLNSPSAKHRIVSVRGISCTPTGHLIVTGSSDHSVYCVNPLTSEVDKLAGINQSGGGYADGPAASVAMFSYPCAVTIDPDERYALVCDNGNHRIRRLPLPKRCFEAL